MKTKMPVVGGVKKVDFQVNNKDVNVTVMIPPAFPAFRAWEYIIKVDNTEIAKVRK